MKPSTPLSQVMHRSFSSIALYASWESIYQQFQITPEASYLPIEQEGKFLGVLYRSDFIKSYLNEAMETNLDALICKNVITLSPDNAYEEAKEIFQFGSYPLIPVVDDWNNLVGTLDKALFNNKKVNIPYPPFTSLFKYQKAS